MAGDLSGLLGIVPRPIRDAMKGVRLAEEGVTDKTGKTMLAPEKLPPSAPLVQALGFQPAPVSEFREGRNAVLEAREEANSLRARLSQRWLDADPADRPAIMSEIRAFNEDPEHQGMMLTAHQLMVDLHNRRKQAREPFGLRLPAKAARTLEQAGRFANLPTGAQVGAP
jgi:hypothetical protein